MPSKFIQVQVEEDLFNKLSLYVLLHKTTRKEWMERMIRETVDKDELINGLPPEARMALGI